MDDVLKKLKDDMERKRKAAELVAPAAEGEEGAKKKKVYLSKGQAKKLEQQISVLVATNSKETGDATKADGPLSPEAVAKIEAAAKRKWISAPEVISRLRALKQPIKLFGESDEERITRLRQAELKSHDDDETGGQKNFMVESKKKEKEKQEQGDSSDEEELTHEEKQAKRREKLAKLNVSEELASRNDDKEAAIKTFIKRVLKEWEIDIEDIPEHVRKTVNVRKEIATFHQTKDYLKPLFKQLKRKNLEADILNKLAQIVKLCRSREYVKAADVYLLLSIGKAAWPMGVTMVGIHERSSREKIFSQDVAHILNDETQRKFIQSVKRLMTYHQNKYPPTSFTQALEPGCIDTHAPDMLKKFRQEAEASKK